MVNKHAISFSRTLRVTGPCSAGPAVPIIRWEIALDPGNNSSKRINQSTTTDTASQPPEPAQHPLTFSPLHGLQLTALPQSQQSEAVVGGDRQTDREIDRIHEKRIERKAEAFCIFAQHFHKSIFHMIYNCHRREAADDYLVECIDGWWWWLGSVLYYVWS